MPFKIKTYYCDQPSEDTCIAQAEKCNKANPKMNMNYHQGKDGKWQTFWDSEELVRDEDICDEFN